MVNGLGWSLSPHRSSSDFEIGLYHAMAFKSVNLPKIVSGKALVFLIIVDLWHDCFVNVADRFNRMVGMNLIGLGD